MHARAGTPSGRVAGRWRVARWSSGFEDAADGFAGVASDAGDVDLAHAFVGGACDGRVAVAFGARDGLVVGTDGGVEFALGRGGQVADTGVPGPGETPTTFGLLRLTVLAGCMPDRLAEVRCGRRGCQADPVVGQCPLDFVQPPCADRVTTVFAGFGVELLVGVAGEVANGADSGAA